MDSSPALAARIQGEAAKLGRYYPRITRCRVIVEAPHRHHRRAEPFHIRIELNVPGAELIAHDLPAAAHRSALGDGAKWSKQFESHAPEKDPYVAVRDAFLAARRRLEDHARRLRGDVKSHGRLAPLRLEKVGAR